MDRSRHSAPEMPGNSKPDGRAKQMATQEDGFLLLAVLFMLVIVLLTLSIAAPTIATSLRREKEIETVHRGMQYAQAIRLYYRQFGRYPNTIDQLVKTNNVRFLRKRYLDPMTGKDDWRLIHLGEAQLGVAGQPTAGSIPGASPIGGSGSPISGNGMSGDVGSGGFGGSPGFASSGSSGPSGSSGSSGPFGPTPGGPPISSPSSPEASGLVGSSGGSSSPFGPSGSFGSSPSPAPSSSPAGGTGGSAFGTPGATFGGAPIVGVGLPLTLTGQSIKVVKKQDHYKQWQFVYDPTQDLGGIMGQTGVGTPQAASPNSIGGSTPGPGSSSGFGNSGNSGFGNSGFSIGPGAGTSPTPPSNPSNPSSPSNPPSTSPQ